MRAKARIVVAACLSLAGCGTKESVVGPAQVPVVASGEKPAVVAPPNGSPCSGLPITARNLPAGTYRTNDVPLDQWPRDYGLPLEITLDLPPVPERIQRPSPPIVEEPER